MYQTANTDPTPPSVYNTEIVQPIVDLLDRALAKDPQLRFQTAAQMAEALRSLDLDVTAERKMKSTVDAATGSETAEVDAKELPIGDNVPMGEDKKEDLDFSDMDQAINLETRTRMEGRSDSTLVIQQGPGELSAARDDATRKIDMSDLSASQAGPSEAPSYQVVKTILPPGDGNDKPAAAQAIDRQAGSRIRTLLTNRFAVYLLAGILLLENPPKTRFPKESIPLLLKSQTSTRLRTSRDNCFSVLESVMFSHV